MKTKSIILLFLMALIASVAVTSCNKLQPLTQTDKPRETARSLNEVQKYAADKPGLRAWGMSQVDNPKYERLARRNANLDARNVAASNIEAKIKSFIKDYLNDHEIEDNGEIEAKTENEIKQVVDQIMKNWVESKAQPFDLNNGGVKYYVCIEYSGDLKKLTSEITQGLKRQLSDEQKKQIDFDEYLFNQELEKEMEEFRIERGQ